MFEKSSDRGGFTIKTTKTGYLYENFNRMQGDVTGRKVLVKFADAEKMGIDKDLNKKWNEICTNGEYLADIISHECIKCKVIRKGEKVL